MKPTDCYSSDFETLRLVKSSNSLLIKLILGIWSAKFRCSLNYWNGLKNYHSIFWRAIKSIVSAPPLTNSLGPSCNSSFSSSFIFTPRYYCLAVLSKHCQCCTVCFISFYIYSTTVVWFIRPWPSKLPFSFSVNEVVCKSLTGRRQLRSSTSNLFWLFFFYSKISENSNNPPQAQLRRLITFNECAEEPNKFASEIQQTLTVLGDFKGHPS